MLFPQPPVRFLLLQNAQAYSCWQQVAKLVNRQLGPYKKNLSQPRLRSLFSSDQSQVATERSEWASISHYPSSYNLLLIAISFQVHFGVKLRASDSSFNLLDESYADSNAKALVRIVSSLKSAHPDNLALFSIQFAKLLVRLECVWVQDLRG